MKYVLKHTPSGWVIELCFPVGNNGYYRTASLRWRSITERLQPEFIHLDYDDAKKACDEKNGVIK